MKLFKDLVILSLLSAALFGCKEEEVIDPNGESGEKNATLFYSIPLMNEASAVYASPDGQILIAEIPEGTRLKYKSSIDAGNTWEALPNVDLRKGVDISNSGLCVPRERTYQFFHLKDQNFQVVNPPVSRNTYYAGWETGLYRLESSSAPSPYPTLLVYDASKMTWDTINKRMDEKGVYIGQDHRGGLAFITTQQDDNRLNIYNPQVDSWIEQDCNIDLLAVRQGQTNRPPELAYNGYDQVLFAHTKGFGITDVTTNMTSFTDWGEGYIGYYENPTAISISRQGDVYANLSSYVNPAITANYDAKSTDVNITFTRSIPTCSGDFTYLMYESKAVKKSINQETELSSLQTAEGNLNYAHVTQDKIYSLAYANFQTQETSLIIRDRNSNSEKIGNIGGILKFVYEDAGKILVTSGNAWQLSEDGGNTWLDVTPENAQNLTQIKQVNGVYYGMSVRKFKQSLGGTGFQVAKFDYAMYTSSDLMTWTLLPGTLKTAAGGEGPESFTSNGVLTYGENTNPLGNAEYEYYISNDFGKTWERTSDFINTINVSSPIWDYYLQVSYSGPGEVSKTQISKNFERGNTVKYKVQNGTAIASRVAQVDDDGNLYYFTNNSILRLE